MAARLCVKDVTSGAVVMIFTPAGPSCVLSGYGTSSPYRIRYTVANINVDGESPYTPVTSIRAGFLVSATVKTGSYYGGTFTPSVSSDIKTTGGSPSQTILKSQFFATPDSRSNTSLSYMLIGYTLGGGGYSDGTTAYTNSGVLAYLTHVVGVSSTGGGTASGGGTITDGNTATLTATATNGASFLGWYLGGTTLVSTSLSYTTPAITAAASYVAKFQESYTVTSSTNNAAHGNGYIGTTGTTTTGSYLDGSTITLRAVAETGYQFVRWEKSGTQISTTANTNVTVSSTNSGTYTAVFEAVSVLVSVSAGNALLGDAYIGASGSNTSASVSYGSSVTLRAIAKTMDASPVFVNWTNNGVEVSTSATYTFTSGLIADAAFVANFSQVKWMVSASVNPADSAKGSVKINGNSVASYWASSNESVALLATASDANKYRFTKWQKNAADFTGNTANPYSFENGTSDNVYVAFFEQYKWLLTTASDNTVVGYTDIVQSGASIGATSWIEKELPVSIRAYVRNEYSDTHQFLEWRWTDNTGTARTSTSATLSISTEARDATYTAFFIQTDYILSVSPANALHGSVSLTVNGQIKVVTTNVTVKAGDSIVLANNPAYGYSFSNWSSSGSVVSSLASYSFTMPYADKTIVCNFSEKTKVVLALTTINPDLGSVVVQRFAGGFQVNNALPIVEEFDLYLGETYQLVATVSDPLNQFDGYFQYYGEELRLIQADATMTFVVSSTAPIDYVCKFSVRTNYTISKSLNNIETVAADPQIITDGCAINITTACDGEIEGVPVWLSGQYINFSVVEAGNWYIRQIEIRDSANASIFNSVFDSEGFSTSVRFKLNDNCTITCWYQNVVVPDLFMCSVGFKGDATGGEVSVYPQGASRNATEAGVSARFYDNTEIVASAMPYPGYKFSGWYLSEDGETPFSTNAVYRAVLDGAAVEVYALFEASSGSVSAFNLGTVNKTFKWRGRHIALTRPENFSCGCVNAADYPVVLQIGSASSPSTADLESRTLDVPIVNQDSVRLPLMRPELFTSIGVEGTGRIISLAIGTNMSELRK